MGGEVWVPNGCTILQMRSYLLDIIIIVWPLLGGSVCRENFR